MKLIILLCAVIALTVGFDYGSSSYARPARYDDYHRIQSPFYVPRRRSDRRHRRHGRHGRHGHHHHGHFDSGSNSGSSYESGSSSEPGSSSESRSSARHSSEEDYFDDYVYYPQNRPSPSYGQPINDVPAPVAYGSNHFNGK